MRCSRSYLNTAHVELQSISKFSCANNHEELLMKITIAVTFLKDLVHGTGRQIIMTSRKVVNIVINSEREANADLLCGSS